MHNTRSIFAAAFALFATAALASAQSPPAQLGRVVNTALGGFILGYDIDSNGTEGVLAEALTLPGGTHDVAVETFDQATGNIVKIVRRLNNSNNDFVTLGVVGNSVGLVEFEQSSGIFVDHRRYVVMNPLNANLFTGSWTPPLTVNDLITGVSSNQGSHNTAFIGFHNGGNDPAFVFTSNVAADTFGPFITPTDPAFSFGGGTKMEIDRATNQGILGNSIGCPNCSPTIGKVDLTTGAQTSFVGLGFGYINGLAVDSATQVLCTTTEIDFSVEFYDLTTNNGFLVTMPGATSQAQSGMTVALDPIHKLFLIQQEFTSTAASGSSIQVFNEQGTYIESINGLSLPASPVRIALNPALRVGWVLVTPNLSSLQSFSY
jgi:hypothetical protein